MPCAELDVPSLGPQFGFARMVDRVLVDPFVQVTFGRPKPWEPLYRETVMVPGHGAGMWRRAADGQHKKLEGDLPLLLLN